MSVEAPEQQAEVLAWLAADRTRGYRTAAKQFGIPAETIRSWAQAARAGKPLPRPNARTRARAHEEPAAVQHPEDLPAWDPTTCSREEFLVERIRVCVSARDLALSQGHGGVARQWETTIGDYRRDLDQLRTAVRREAEAAGRTEVVSPEVVAERLLRSLPALARVAPSVAREIWQTLGQALGEWEGG